MVVLLLKSKGKFFKRKTFIVRKMICKEKKNKTNRFYGQRPSDVFPIRFKVWEKVVYNVSDFHSSLNGFGVQHYLNFLSRNRR